MRFGNIQVTKKTTAGDCDHCKEPLELGVYHITVSIRAKARKSGKHWFVNWHLHMRCIAVWLMAQLVARQDRRKAAGRPIGSGLKLPPEDKRRRLALCKRRMRIFQEVSACIPKDGRLKDLFLRFKEVDQAINDIGGPAKVNSRTILDIPTIEKKLKYGEALCNT